LEIYTFVKVYVTSPLYLINYDGAKKTYGNLTLKLEFGCVDIPEGKWAARCAPEPFRDVRVHTDRSNLCTRAANLLAHPLVLFFLD
jgi:hypothetical protein